MINKVFIQHPVILFILFFHTGLFAQTGKAAAPVFSFESGFYNQSITLNISAPEENARIYFSSDGSVPGENSELFTDDIHIDSTTVIKAVVYADSLQPSEVITKTYFINENFTLPVFSISTDPQNLWDPDSGIYVEGPNAEPEYPHFGANYWQDWEKPAFIEMFEPGGTVAFAENCGIKIFGGWSRAHPQKSLSVFFRKKYGKKKISYQLFPDKPLFAFKSFILRNSGDDWSATMFHDALLQKIVENLDLETQSYRPAIVFLNGEYWGIQNIREKINEDYLEEHYGVDSKKVDLLENNSVVLEGSNSDYLELLDFVSNNDPANDENYEYVKSKIDIGNFIDYQLSEIYFNNTDWPGNNVKYWRDNEHKTKWRWILFDTDYSYGFVNPGDYTANTLAFAMEDDGPDWPNPPWSTLLLRKLILNQEFKNEFVARYCDYANTIFNSGNILPLIESFKQKLEPEIDRHIERWGAFDRQNWEREINIMKTFALRRLSYLTLHFRETLNLDEQIPVTINTQNPGYGSVKINSIVLEDYPWTGNYFKHIPIKLKAIPKPGYKFVEWSGDVSFEAKTITLTPEQPVNITAVFAPGASSNKIVINEINYNSASDFDPEDWIELYNNSPDDVDISGWIFKDGKETHSYKIPENTVLESEKYLVLTRDTTLFRQSFPKVENFVGPFVFGLSGGGEKIRLFDDAMNIIDSLTYDDKLPWPEEADGEGKTLELFNPNRDNSKPESWHASSNGHGTPGEQNSVFTSVTDIPANLKETLELDQNYPNPFNPSTTIKYSIPSSIVFNSITPEKSTAGVHVILKVYDVLGEEVAVLVNGKQLPGTYQVTFDTRVVSGGLPSGMYFYRLTAGGFSFTRKMMLLK